MNRRSIAMLLVLAAAGTLRADGGEGERPAVQAPVSSSDALTLKDGRRIEGEIVDENERFVSLKSGGVTRAYAKDAIASVERAPRGPGAAPSPAEPGAAPSSPGDPAGKVRKKPPGQGKDAPLTEAARAWLGELLARSADPDDAVRRSIAAAVGAMGPQALPAVRAAEAAAADGPQRQFLGRLAADIETRRDKRQRGEPEMPGQGTGEPGAAPGDTPGMPPKGPGLPRRGLDDMVQRLTGELELRDDQVPKVRPILEASMKKRFALGRDAKEQGLSAEQVDERLAPIRADLLAQMKTVLDEPQFSMFEEMAKRIFEIGRGPMGPPPGKPGEPEPAK